MEYVLICYGFRPIVFQAGTTAEAATKAAETAKAAGMHEYLCYNRRAEIVAESHDLQRVSR